MRDQAKLKYSKHKAQAKYRNIDFKLTFEEWNDWWLQQGVDKSTDHFSISDNTRPCMCRYNDTGAYELGNIYCTSQRKNIKDNWKYGTLLEKKQQAEEKKLLERKRIEYKKICKQYRLTYGSIRQQTYWPTYFGTLVPTKKQAIAESKTNQHAYDKKLRLGEIKKQFVGKDFVEFYKETTKYPLPLYKEELKEPSWPYNP